VPEIDLAAGEPIAGRVAEAPRGLLARRVLREALGGQLADRVIQVCRELLVEVAFEVGAEPEAAAPAGPGRAGAGAGRQVASRTRATAAT
jgi:hypothetical protein